MENTIREVYCTIEDPQARNAIMTIARKGLSAQPPKLATITGVTGSDATLVSCKVSRVKLRVRAAELKSTTLPTIQREKKIARVTIRLGSCVSSAIVEQASKPINAHPEMASAARNAAVELGAVPVPRWENSSENSCCRKKKNNRSATPNEPTISAYTPKEISNLKTKTWTRLRMVQTSRNTAPQMTRVMPVPLDRSEKQSPTRPRRYRRSS